MTFTTPAGYTITYQNQGADDNLDSDISQITGTTASINVISGQIQLNHDAGFIKTGAQIGDFAFEDVDGDGIQDAGEPGIPGVTVTLNGTTGNGTAVTQTTTTDASGLYLFNNLIPGNYTVTFTTPAGYTITYQNQGADDNLDSDISQITGTTASINVISGQIQLNHDAGFIKTGCTDRRFCIRRRGRRRIQDAGEPGIPGVTVTLNGTTGNGTAVTQTTTTDASGLYLFNNLIPGNYTVTFTTPAGYTITYQNQGADDNLDSDISQITGTTASINVISGQIQLNHDAGFIKTVCTNRRFCIRRRGRRRHSRRWRTWHSRGHRDFERHDG